jgi:hypothetical protein
MLFYQRLYNIIDLETISSVIHFNGGSRMRKKDDQRRKGVGEVERIGEVKKTIGIERFR